MEYRLAIAADSSAIAALITLTWGGTAHADWIADIIALPHHAVWLALENENHLGFCAGFTTRAIDGLLRWEVDLLAVHPDARGKGIGKMLVAESVKTGFARGARFQRGLIAADNTASERCFAASGFAAAHTCNLWIGAPATAEKDAPVPDGAHLIPVKTLTYSAIWVENNHNEAALRAAQQTALRTRHNTVGAVVPQGGQSAADALHFAHIDTYQWWVLDAVD